MQLTGYVSPNLFGIEHLHGQQATAKENNNSKDVTVCTNMHKQGNGVESTVHEPKAMRESGVWHCSKRRWLGGQEMGHVLEANHL